MKVKILPEIERLLNSLENYKKTLETPQQEGEPELSERRTWTDTLSYIRTVRLVNDILPGLIDKIENLTGRLTDGYLYASLVNHEQEEIDDGK